MRVYDRTMDMSSQASRPFIMDGTFMDKSLYNGEIN